MTTTLTSASVDSALRRGFSEASVRVQPTTRMTDVIAAMSTMGISADVQDGLLVLKQGDTVFHTGQALRSFATKPEQAKFFVLETDDPRSWPNEMKIKFIKEHGADAWARKIHGPVLEAGLKVLDANMSKADYAKLSRAEKVQFISEFGYGAVQAIMGKAK